MKVGICAIIKDCKSAYLNEWLDWHRLIGVDEFFIYDNESAEPITNVIQDMSAVSVIPILGKCKQLEAYNNCILRQKISLNPCDWVAFIDDDEFLVFECGNIKTFLKNKKSSGVGLNWCVFGAGKEEDSNLPQIQKYVKHVPVISEINKHIKSIVQPSKVFKFSNPHYCVYTDGFCVSAEDKPVERALTETPIQKVAWINHYYCKSAKEFKEKIKKGRSDAEVPYTMKHFNDINNEATETSIKIIEIQQHLLYPDLVQMRDQNGVDALEAMIKTINRQQDVSEMTMVEIGSYAGASTVVFAKWFKNVIAIDPHVNHYDEKDPTCKRTDFEIVHKLFLERIRHFPNIQYLRKTSEEAVNKIEEADFVYLDGNHSYEFVKKDIQLYLPKIKGLFIGGHDYVSASHLGVLQAVQEILGTPDNVFADFSWLKEINKKKSNSSSNSIVLITPTGGRPYQFKRCVQWMRNQTYQGKVLWIIIDDCFPVTTDINEEDFPANWTILHKYPRPIWEKGKNTQARNLLTGINIIKKLPEGQVNGIFIIEDDDYYTSSYLEVMMEKLKGYFVAGQMHTIYYNIPLKGGKKHLNGTWSSLFQTAFTIEAIPDFEKSCGPRFIDIEFFKNASNINLFDGDPLAIGIKGLKGRAGIGVGHRNNMRTQPDINEKWFKEFLRNDAKEYLK